MAILDKKEFYKMLLHDRYPIVRIEFPTETGAGNVEFYSTPLGTALKIYSGGARLKEIKMYDRREGDFSLQSIFCGENLVCVGEFLYICVVNKLQIQDVIGRKFLIKLEDINIIARAEFIDKYTTNIDKRTSLVYN